MDIDFDKLAGEMALDRLEQYVAELDEKAPGVMTVFYAGRFLGRVDILSQLVEIVDRESKLLNEYQNSIKGKKND